MKSLLLATLFTLLGGLLSGPSTTVYVSTGKKAYAYHAQLSCRALKRCREEGHVKAVTLKMAMSMGRKPCKICCR